MEAGASTARDFAGTPELMLNLARFVRVQDLPSLCLTSRVFRTFFTDVICAWDVVAQSFDDYLAKHKSRLPGARSLKVRTLPWNLNDPGPATQVRRHIEEDILPGIHNLESYQYKVLASILPASFC